MCSPRRSRTRRIPRAAGPDQPRPSALGSGGERLGRPPATARAASPTRPSPRSVIDPGSGTGSTGGSWSRRTEEAHVVDELEWCRRVLREGSLHLQAHLVKAGGDGQGRRRGRCAFHVSPAKITAEVVAVDNDSVEQQLEEPAGQLSPDPVREGSDVGRDRQARRCRRRPPGRCPPPSARRTSRPRSRRGSGRFTRSPSPSMSNGDDTAHTHRASPFAVVNLVQPDRSPVSKPPLIRPACAEAAPNDTPSTVTRMRIRMLTPLIASIQEQEAYRPAETSDSRAPAA